MCTITLLPGPDGHLILAGNRDEHRLRPRALPPTARREDDKAHLAIYPIDASAGGTWVGANAPGVVATLLNNYQASSVFDTGDATPRSRGLLIPELLARCRNLDEVEAWLQRDLAEHLARTFPFLLVAASRHAPHEALRVDWRGHGAPDVARVEAPLIEISSGADLEGVTRSRHEALAGLLDVKDFTQDARFANAPEALSGFFASPSPDAYSVSMSREDAHTVSHTRVLLTPQGTTLTYVDGPPGDSARVATSTVHLPALVTR